MSDDLQISALAAELSKALMRAAKLQVAIEVAVAQLGQSPQRQGAVVAMVREGLTGVLKEVSSG